MSSGLVTLLRALPAPREHLENILRNAESRCLVVDAARHGLAALLWHELETAGLRLPEPHHQGLQRTAWASTVQTLKVKRLLLSTLDALQAEGVVPVLLKGYALGLRLYPTPLTRIATDVDLWVHRSAYAAAAQALRNLGLRGPDGRLESSDSQKHHRLFEGPLGAVELHFRPIASYGRALEGDAFWSQRRPSTLEGRAVQYLRPEDELVYLALHAMHHLMQRMAWIYDLKLFCLRHPELDWPRVARVAEETGFGPLVYLALAVAHSQLGAPIPMALLSALAPAKWRQRVADWLFAPDRLESASLARFRPGWVCAKFLLSEDWRGVARLTWHRLGSLFVQS